jgi:hypothetical protein
LNGASPYIALHKVHFRRIGQAARHKKQSGEKGDRRKKPFQSIPPQL